MPTISLGAARSILSPHHDALLQCVKSGWDGFASIKSRMALWHATTRANIVWGFMVDQARTLFADVPGVRLLDSGERFVIVVREEVIVRLKKLNEQLETSNYPTPTAGRVDSQLPIQGIPSSATWLTVGYVLNTPQTEIASVNVVCAVGKRVEWEYSLTEPSSLVEQLPLVPPQQQAARVRAKGAGAKIAEQAGARRGGLWLVKKNDTEK